MRAGHWNLHLHLLRPLIHQDNDANYFPIRNRTKVRAWQFSTSGTSHRARRHSVISWNRKFDNVRACSLRKVTTCKRKECCDDSGDMTTYIYATLPTTVLVKRTQTLQQLLRAQRALGWDSLKPSGEERLTTSSFRSWKFNSSSCNTPPIQSHETLQSRLRFCLSAQNVRAKPCSINFSLCDADWKDFKIYSKSRMDCCKIIWHIFFPRNNQRSKSHNSLAVYEIGLDWRSSS